MNPPDDTALGVPAVRPDARRLDDLQRIAAIAGELKVRGLADEATAVASRLGEGRFFVAGVGQFKRGKSTLLNALVGERVLPVAVNPVTSAITVLRYGPTRTARVTFATGVAQTIPVAGIHAYVTEAENPENIKGVTVVEAFLPHPLLASGLCLVDTPGIGSVFAGNTEMTHRFVPHIDAALVVLGGDPPVSGDELALIEDVARQVEHLVFVINKADRLSDADVRDARSFTERLLLDRIGPAVGSVLEVSAAERLETGRPTRDWATLQGALESFVADSASLLRQTATRAVSRLTSRLLGELEERRGALRRPVEESERRVTQFQGSIADATVALGDLGVLFAAEQGRLVRVFDEKQEQFLRSMRAAAGRELGASITAAEPRRGTALRGRAYELAQDLARRLIADWLQRMEPEAEAMYRHATSRFIDLANQFLDRLQSSDDSAFARLPRALDPEVGFRKARGFYHTEMMRLTGVGPFTWLLDCVRPRAFAMSAIERDATRYLDQLLEVNSSRVAHDFDERVLESRRALESEIRFLLNEVAASAERALAHARATCAAGEAAVSEELQRLDALAEEIDQLSGRVQESHGT
jgi:hypothetical protein